MGVFYIGGREGRCGMFRRLCVGMILGWDFLSLGVCGWMVSLCSGCVGCCAFCLICDA